MFLLLLGFEANGFCDLQKAKVGFAETTALTLPAGLCLLASGLCPPGLSPLPPALRPAPPKLKPDEEADALAPVIEDDIPRATPPKLKP